MPLYAIFLLPLLAVMALRMIAMARRPGGRNAVDGTSIRGGLDAV
jgi:sulfoxide reductase heme-binding subunit YedZ